MKRFIHLFCHHWCTQEPGANVSYFQQSSCCSCSSGCYLPLHIKVNWQRSKFPKPPYSDKRKSIEYWSDGGVLRWNQIFRELVARYNLPPAPSQRNIHFSGCRHPFADPQFPLPILRNAARAYSYVSVRCMMRSKQLVLQVLIQSSSSLSSW